MQQLPCARLSSVLLACLLLSSSQAALLNWQQDLSQAEHDSHLSAVKAAPRGAFQEWVEHHQKEYAGDVQELERRFAIWADNLDFAIEYNQKTRTHWIGLNSLADLSHDEYRERLGYRPELRQGQHQLATPFMYSNSSTPPSIDWRKKNAVTPVKNQMQCGSCWSFSATGAVEGVNAIFSGDLVSLSEQELVDCDLMRDQGCHGGLMDYAFKFIMSNHGLDTEQDYKYTAEQMKCSLKRERRHVVTIDGYQDVPPNNETALMQAAAHQPISVAIEADQREFQLYNGGVFDGPCGTALDHGVLVVGYGTEGGKPYWLIKNSWGNFWGDFGYIKLVRNLESSAMGQCGVAMHPSYPIKKTPNPPKPAPTPPQPPTPPKPQPVECDSTSSCPDGSTCCCMRDFLGYCLSWACCPLENAVCCDDHQHCCAEHMTCDTAAGRCLAGAGHGFDDSVPWVEKQPASRVSRAHSWIPDLPWNRPHMGNGSLVAQETTSEA